MWSKDLYCKIIRYEKSCVFYRLLEQIVIKQIYQRGYITGRNLIHLPST